MALAGLLPLVVAGCQSGQGTPASSPPPTPPATVTVASPPAGSGTPTTRPECANLVASGQALAASVAQLIDGSGSRDQVRTAAAQMSSAIDSAQHTVGADVSARLTDAKAALQRVVDAAGAQPPDTAGMRTAANDLVTSLHAAAASCQSAPRTSG